MARNKKTHCELLIIKVRDLLDHVDCKHIKWDTIRKEMDVALAADSERSEPKPKPASVSKRRVKSKVGARRKFVSKKSGGLGDLSVPGRLTDI